MHGGAWVLMMEREIAARVLNLALEHSAELNKLVEFLQERASEEDFRKYRLAIGQVMGEMLRHIINPILDEHEDLRPPGLHKYPKRTAS
jgi:hypothetical protein